MGKGKPVGRRQQRKRPVKRTCLVVTEGKKTEPDYLLDLNRQEFRLSIQVSDGHSDPGHVVSGAVRRKRDSEDGPVSYDEIWCVFDADDISAETLESAMDRARSEGIWVALSNPCFELWLLLHYRYTTGQMRTCKKARNLLRKHVPGYEKSAPACSELRERLAEAIANAEKLRKHHRDSTGGKEHTWNPCTGVDALVRALQKAAREQKRARP